MIRRTKDVELFSELMEPFLPIKGLDPESWLKNDFNVALIDDKENLALFERQWLLTKTVTGHYFFKSRGKDALIASKKMLKEIFTGPYSIEVIAGITPVDHKGALWMNRQIGFKSHGQIDTEIGPCEFVILTKQEWENGQNE